MDCLGFLEHEIHLADDSEANENMTTIVLGIDGATFDLFEEWLPNLPVLSSILKEGAVSELNSSTPPVTSPAWRTYATGKNPANLGVYWWRQLDRSTGTFEGADKQPLDSKCYWEYLSEDKVDVAVMGVPLNAPPRRVNGQLISGGPFANPENYTYPEELSETLEQEFDYQLHPKLYPSISEARQESVVRDFEGMIEQRFDVAEWIRSEHDPELLNLTLFYINTMQHKAWDAPEVKVLWETIDQRLGNLLQDGDDVVVHSDHGLHKVERVFYLNAWLQDQGYLVLAPQPVTEQVSNTVIKWGKRSTETLGIKSLVKAALPESFLSGDRRLIDSTSFESRIDLENSKAVALPQGPVYVLTDEEGFENQLREDLLSVTDPKTGRSPVRAVERVADVYGEPVPEDAPDLLVRWPDGYEIKDIHSFNPMTVFGPPQGVLADNQQHGIFVVYGPSFATGHIDDKIPDLQDLAPTLMHLHGSAVPEDMDGSVIEGVFAEGTDASDRPVESQPGKQVRKKAQESAQQNVNGRLRDLGYLE